MRERGLKFVEKTSKSFETLKDPKLAEGMKSYMKNQFEFYGILYPDRRRQVKALIKGEDTKDLDLCFFHTVADECLKSKYREMHHAFIDITNMCYRDKLNHEYLKKLEEVNIKGKWWDTTDSLSEFFGIVFLKDKKLHLEKNQEYIVHSDMWMRRIAIIHQLKFKDKTDEDILYENILKTCHEKDFFIRKAIGWSLREYSKTNPKSVVEFVLKNKSKLSKLSKLEAIKYMELHKNRFKGIQIPTIKQLDE